MDTVSGMFSFVVEPDVADQETVAAIFVREDPRLAARALLFLEGARAAGGRRHGAATGGGIAPRAPAAPSVARRRRSNGERDGGVLRQTDDLKKIIESVEHEVIDRTMRRVEGNQSRGAQILNISRGSLIAKLKEYGIPDYRYLRRERNRKALTRAAGAPGLSSTLVTRRSHQIANGAAKRPAIW